MSGTNSTYSGGHGYGGGSDSFWSHPQAPYQTPAWSIVSQTTHNADDGAQPAGSTAANDGSMDEADRVSEDGEQQGGEDLPAFVPFNILEEYAVPPNATLAPPQGPIPSFFNPNFYQQGNSPLLIPAFQSLAPHTAYFGFNFPEYADLDSSCVDGAKNSYDVTRFIERWGMAAPGDPLVETIGPECAVIGDWERSRTILREHLRGDRYDVQGINWQMLATTRDRARVMRNRLAPICAPESHMRRSNGARDVDNKETFFRFRQMNTEHEADMAHFQLRNLICARSRSDIYYATKLQINRTDAASQDTTVAMDLRKSTSSSAMAGDGFDITSLTASDDLLVAGGFHGKYAYSYINSEAGTKLIQGTITNATSGITNHVQTFQSRHSSNTNAAFCSNDESLRILDCVTNQFTNHFKFPRAINCSAVCPNARMRVVVGDFRETLITDAETGEIITKMSYHEGDAFACVWADDGIHLATAAQDNQVVIYDARFWNAPVSTIATELSCARSLRFSPIGGGRRVLLAAESFDVVNVIDAVDFQSKQVLDFYGDIGGVSFSPDGSSFFALNTDRKFGGIIEYERIGHGEQFGLEDFSRTHLGWNPEQPRKPFQGPREWVDEAMLDANEQLMTPRGARKRRGLELEDMIV